MPLSTARGWERSEALSESFPGRGEGKRRREGGEEGKGKGAVLQGQPGAQPAAAVPFPALPRESSCSPIGPRNVEPKSAAGRMSHRPRGSG